MGRCLLVFLIFCSFIFVSLQAVVVAAENGGRTGSSNGVVEGTVFIDEQVAIGRTDDDFICATLDWWPPEKCDYGTCSWDHASLINLDFCRLNLEGKPYPFKDLSNNILLNAVKAFSPLKIRLGGTLQDKVIYDTDDNPEPCVQFVANASQIFGFTQGCLTMSRWDELNAFFEKAGVKVIFGLNALNGRTINRDGSAVGDWNYTNAASFIKYTAQKNYAMYGWELGNELSGNGVGARIAADQYASDTAALYNIVQQIYSDIAVKPLIISPGGFFDIVWFKEFLDKTGNKLDVVTHHIYNLGPGSDEHLVEKILNPSYLDGEANTFSAVQSTIRISGTSASAWVGEAGGAYNSGRNLVSNAFVYSFWYLDQLGMASSYDSKTYCRQSLVGGNYGLLDTTTFVPNPDYYSALLWHRLMGRNALATSFSGTKKIRAYTHCHKTKGITLLLINLDNSTTVQVNVKFNSSWSLQHKHRSHETLRRETFLLHHKKSAEGLTRSEYHLTAQDGDLHSRTMLLNGNLLTVDSSGNIPSFKPRQVNMSGPITVPPFSIVFAHMPYLLPACR